MKLTNKYMMFATAALLLASCDLDKYPEGQYVSDNQKEETIKDLSLIHISEPTRRS